MPSAAQTVGLVERLLLLKKLTPLADLPPEDLAVLAEHVRERFFKKGSVLLRDGEPVSSLYIVVDGLVRCARGGRALGDVGPVDGAVGGLAVFARDSQGLSACAATDVFALELDTDTLLEILEDRFTILHHLMRQICGQLQEILVRRPAHLGLVAPGPRPPAVPDQDLNLVERLFFLRQSPPFARTSLNALAVLSRGMVEITFGQGMTLWNAGDPSRTVLLVVSGSASGLFPNGERFVAGPGTPLGAIESVAERPRWYTAVADTNLVALHGDAQGLLDVMEDNFDMAMDFLAVMSLWMLACLENTPEGDPLRSFFGCGPSAECPQQK